MKISITASLLALMATSVAASSSTSTPPVAFMGKFFKKGGAAATEEETATTPEVAPGPKLPPNILDNRGLDDVFAKNQEWKKRMIKEDRDYFNKLGTTHTPEYMWIGCADARVPANLVMGEDAGNVFVHRNVANMVTNNDVNLMSAIQYGVAYLKVTDIIVCGHYECGGVRAAEANNDFVAPLETWLRNIRDVYRMHKDELDAIEDANERHYRLVDLNVVEQCINLFKNEAVQKRRKETYLEGEEMLPRIHAMVFNPNTGDLKRIPVSGHKDILLCFFCMPFCPQFSLFFETNLSSLFVIVNFSRDSKRSTSLNLKKILKTFMDYTLWTIRFPFLS